MYKVRRMYKFFCSFSVASLKAKIKKKIQGKKYRTVSPTHEFHNSRMKKLLIPTYFRNILFKLTNFFSSSLSLRNIIILFYNRNIALEIASSHNSHTYVYIKNIFFFFVEYTILLFYIHPLDAKILVF